MSEAICPECAQTKHSNCTREALDEATNMLVACECMDRGHRTVEQLADTIWAYLDQASTQGAPPAEIRHRLGVVAVTDALDLLAHQGRAVKGLAGSWFALGADHTDDPQDPQIGVQSVERISEGTDMSDMQDRIKALTAAKDVLGRRTTRGVMGAGGDQPPDIRHLFRLAIYLTTGAVVDHEFNLLWPKPLPDLVEESDVGGKVLQIMEGKREDEEPTDG